MTHPNLVAMSGGPSAPCWALITGASRRGGAAIAKALHARGYSVVIQHTQKSLEAGNELLDELNAIRENSAAQWIADFATEKLKIPRWLCDLRIEVCVYCASEYVANSATDELIRERDWSIHVVSAARLLRALCPDPSASTLKSVVTISDIAVERPTPGYSSYTVTKAALQALTLCLAADWAPYIRCNVVQPGTLPYPVDWNDKERSEKIEASIPLRRTGTFKELAELVAFLALDATYVTGQVWAVDGGRTRFLA